MQRSSNVPFDRAGSSPALAHAQHWGRERRVLSAYQPGATVLRGSAVAGREPQPRLDRARWPAPPGPQFEWEPRRVVGSVSEQRERMEAPGNAVIPYQIYPLFAGIVERERTMEDGAV